MARLVFRTVLAAVLSVPFAAIFFNEAPASSGQPVRRHGHNVASNESARGATTPVWKLVVGL